MQDGAPRRRRARPVADAPVEQLLLHAEDLTKGWLLALLEEAPLDDAPAILAADLARDGPRVCDAVIRALADDSDLRRLAPGGALESLVSRAGELAGAVGAEATSRAVEALRAIIWSALRAWLPAPDPDQITDLAERLARVIEVVRAAALRRSAELEARLGAAGGAVPVPHRPPAVPAPPPAPEAVPEPAAEAAPGTAREAAPEAVPGTASRTAPEPASETPAGSGEGPGAGVASPEAAPARWPLHRVASPAAAPPASRVPEPPAGSELRPADALWIGAVEDEIARSEHSGSPLSLLLVELEESDRVLTVERPFEARATFGRFAQAVRAAVRRQDILACETDARAWIIARDTARTGAQALAYRVATAVRETEPWRGAPLAVSAGVAVLGQDGTDAASLIEAAEEAKFAAAARGLSVVGSDWDDAPEKQAADAERGEFRPRAEPPGAS